MENKRYRTKDGEHVLACFKALGRCGSARSVPVLRRLLFQGGWFKIFRQPERLTGAVVALRAMDIPAAVQVLEEAEKSRHPGVRQALRRASDHLRSVRA